MCCNCAAVCAAVCVAVCVAVCCLRRSPKWAALPPKLLALPRFSLPCVAACWSVLQRVAVIEIFAVLECAVWEVPPEVCGLSAFLGRVGISVVTFFFKTWRRQKAFFGGFWDYVSRVQNCRNHLDKRKLFRRVCCNVCCNVFLQRVLHCVLQCVLPCLLQCEMISWTRGLLSRLLGRGGGLGSRPKKWYGERLGDGVEYHSMKPEPRR